MLIFIDMWYTILHLSKPQNYIYIYMYTVYQTYVWQNGNSWTYSNFGTHLRSFLSNPAAPLCWCPAIPWNWTISFHPMQPDATDPWMPGPPGWNLQWTKESRHVNGHFEYVCMSVCPSVCIYVCVCVCHVCVNHLRRCKTSTSVFTCSFQAGDFISF